MGYRPIRTYNESYIIIYNLRIYPCRCAYVPLTVYFWDTHEDILVAVFFARDFFFFFLTAIHRGCQYEKVQTYLGAYNERVYAFTNIPPTGTACLWS